MNIKAIFFDVEGTFLHIYPSVGEIYSKVWKEFGYFFPSQALQESFKKAYYKIFLNSNEKEWNLSKCKNAWKKLFELVFSSVPPKLIEKVFEKTYNLFSTKEQVKIVPGFSEVLKKLKKKNLQLGIISNWDERFYNILTEYGILKFFDGIFLGCETGYLKPDEKIFLKALNTLKVKSEESLMIGDSLEEDIKPAKKLGFQTYLYKGESFREVFEALKIL